MKNSILLLSVLLLGVPAVHGQEQSPPTEENTPPQEGEGVVPQEAEDVVPQEGEGVVPQGAEDVVPQEGEEAAPLPRVVGQPRTKEEYDSWKAVVETEDAQERVRLAKAFLQDYPDSGLTPYAHHTLADAAYQNNDIEGFTVYAEKALMELPEAPELLAQLSYLYAEKGEAAKATEYASRALPLLEKLEKNAGIPSIEWVSMRRALQADAHYALGRSHLQKWHSSSIKPPKELEQAIEHLKEALELAPDHAYAAFRLGFAQKHSENAEAALAAYARASIIEGPAASLAKKSLQTIHKNLRKNASTKWGDTNVDLILKDEGDLLRKLLKEREQELARLAAQIDSREMLQLNLPPVTLPTPPGQ